MLPVVLHLPHRLVDLEEADLEEEVDLEEEAGALCSVDREDLEDLEVFHNRRGSKFVEWPMLCTILKCRPTSAAFWTEINR